MDIFNLITMGKPILIIIWLICFMALWTMSAMLISAPNTFLVLVGVAMLIAFFWISAKTKCFTIFANINFKKEKK